MPFSTFSSPPPLTVVSTIILYLQEVLARNDAGFHFPVYAICLGFEILTMIISEVIYGQNICIYIACNDQTFPFQLFLYFPFCQTDSVRGEGLPMYLLFKIYSP